jgi:hypothetical protein
VTLTIFPKPVAFSRSITNTLCDYFSDDFAKAVAMI